MIVKVPSFYKDFKCTASDCSDSCCIGWEIDIDEDTAKIYKSVNGDFGKRLKENIETDGYTYFKLTNDERCPFLNKNNLCDIILNIGEEKLCDICREHPRFHSWYGSYKESGLGLCCEEAVRLLLTNALTFEDIETDEEDDDLPFDRDTFEEAYKIREELLNNDESIFPKLKEFDLDYILSLLSEAEPIDDNWTKTFEEILKNKDTIMQRFFDISQSENEKYSKIAKYLVFRYFLKNAVYEDKISESIFFVCVFIMLLRCVDILYPDTPIENVKLISKQTEYSEENMQIIYEGILNGTEKSNEKRP